MRSGFTLQHVSSISLTVLSSAGQSVSLVALGDSISSDDGTSQPEYTWIHWVFEWIQLVFPHPEHKLHFVPAINGTSLSPCVLKGLPPMMDIILMESSQCGPTSSGAPDEAARCWPHAHHPCHGTQQRQRSTGAS